MVDALKKTLSRRFVVYFIIIFNESIFRFFKFSRNKNYINLYIFNKLNLNTLFQD